MLGLALKGVMPLALRSNNHAVLPRRAPVCKASYNDQREQIAVPGLFIHKQQKSGRTANANQYWGSFVYNRVGRRPCWVNDSTGKGWCTPWNSQTMQCTRAHRHRSRPLCGGSLALETR